MKRLALLASLAFALSSCDARPAFAVGITQIAAGTTIAVNVMEIKQNIHRVKTAAKAVKHAAVKVAKKASGK